jgi:hypothetical protein
VARSEQSDKVLFRIVAEPTMRLNVMKLEVSQAAARMASPSVPLEDPSMEFLVE